MTGLTAKITFFAYAISWADSSLLTEDDVVLDSPSLFHTQSIYFAFCFMSLKFCQYVGSALSICHT